jgi:hypothetical protein
LRAVARILPVLLLALVGCGGGGEDDAGEVKQTVRDFVQATNKHDGDTLCEDLLTREYMEKATGATGDGVDEACKEQLDLTAPLTLGVVSIGEPKIDGDDATVRAVIDTDGVQTPRLFRLEREDGRWKLADGSSG